MNAVLRRRLERAARVRDFIRAHRTDGAGEGTALARLEELLQRAEALAAQQRAGVVATRSATMQRRELRHTLQTKLLKYLAAVGAVAAKGNTELAPQFRLPPSGASHQGFLTAARGMLEKASAQKELLVSRGMSGTLVDDLAAALAQFEKTLEATRAGRRDHVGASRRRRDRMRSSPRRDGAGAVGGSLPAAPSSPYGFASNFVAIRSIARTRRVASVNR